MTRTRDQKRRIWQRDRLQVAVRAFRLAGVEDPDPDLVLRAAGLYDNQHRAHLLSMVRHLVGSS